jgi:hypothetical protein
MSDSQPLLLENFQEIYNFFGTDHENFNTALFPNADAGKHMQLTLTEQDKTLITNPSNTSWVLFQAISQFGLANEIYSRNSANALLDFSDAVIRIDDEISWMSLPSGIIIKWASYPRINIETDQFNLNGKFTFHWNAAPDEKPFTNQFWSAVFTQTTNDTTVITDLSSLSGVPLTRQFKPDNPAVFTVFNISDPSKVDFLGYLGPEVLFAFPNKIIEYTGSLLVVSIGD